MGDRIDGDGKSVVAGGCIVACGVTNHFEIDPVICYPCRIFSDAVFLYP